MGNLCSSGTERSDKKDETRVLDKPRDGEDEALLPTAGVELGVGPDGVEASVEAKEGVADGGLGGFLGHAVKTGESAFSDVTKDAKEEGEFTVASVQKCWQEKTQVVDTVKATATGVVTEGVENVKTAAVEAVNRAVDDVKTKATDAYQSAVGKLQGTAGEVSDSVAADVTNVEDFAKVQATALEGQVADVKNKSNAWVAEGTAVTDLASENVQGFANREQEIPQPETELVSTEMRSSAEETAQTGIFGNIKVGFGKTTDQVKNNVTSVAADAKQTAGSVADNAKQTAASLADDAKQTAASVADDAKQTAASVADDAKQTAVSVADDAKQTAASVTDDAKQTAASLGDDAKQTAASLADDAKQTAENKINEAVDSAKSSASETLASWSESASQKVSEVAGNVNQNAEWNTDSASQTNSILKSTDDAARHSGFDKPSFDSLEFPTTKAVQVESPGIPSAVEDAENVIARSLLEQQAEGTRVFENVTSSAEERSHELSGEAERLFDSVQETCSTGFEEAVSVGGKVPQTFSDDFNEAYVAGTKEVADSIADPVLQNPFSHEQHEERLDAFAGVQETANDALKAAVERAQSEALTNVGFEEEVRTGETEQDSRNEAGSEFDQHVRSDGDFLEKAKSLLETHRNSIDGGTHVPVTEEDAEDTENPPEQAPGSDESLQEATAREFVESIIEKATSLVSESQVQSQLASDSSSPSDPVIDRGEETLAPKKRGVMFVSPQISEKSSSSLSSPQELSPPPPPQESDLSALADSSSSSISQGDLVETDELLEPPPLPSAYSVSENNNNNNNIVNNNAEDDDESIQRVAMEVTAKAVQDAIKIVAENGTGLVLSSSDLINNDTGVSSPSSPGNDDDEITTTDSSQVERGSPVSDITDTSAHGSVSESLSSYDPGAAFRQDFAGTADLASSPSGSNIAPHPETSVSKPHDKMADLINFEEGSTFHAETPTPTNPSSFDTYPHQSAQESVGDPSSALSSDVPSSFSPLDELPSSPSKPTIVINSPDSAHHTNGSCEDISSPLTEALI